MSSNLVKDSFDYYDSNYDEFESFLNGIDEIQIWNIQDDEMTPNEILFLQGESKIHKSPYQIIGMYTTGSNSWIWAWASPTLEKKDTYIIAKVLNYGIQLNPSKNMFLKTELITSRFIITNMIQLELHIAIGSYLAKVPFIIGIYKVGDKHLLIKNINDISKLPKNTKILFLYVINNPY